MARLIVWEDDLDFPVLLLEDLSQAVWPPPWTVDRVSRVIATLEQVRVTPVAALLPSAESYRESLSGWIRVAEDPKPFLSLHLASSSWLQTSLPVLLDATRRARLHGSSLVHFDIRSDNICFEGARTLLVDWPNACCGNPSLDFVGWLPSLTLEGGSFHKKLTREEVELLAMISGYWASRAGLPPPEGATSVRSIQLAQLRIALPWAVDLLKLPPLDGHSD